MGKKITIIGFIGLFIGFSILIIGVPLRNLYMVFGGYGACVVFPVIAIIGVMLD